MIDRRKTLSGAEFRAAYRNTKTPVILQGMMDDWPALSLWTKDYLAMVCGDQLVEVMSDREADPLFEIHCDSHRSTMLFAEFVDIAFSPVVSNNVYMVANNQFMTTPGGLRLMQDVRPMPEYFFDDARQVFLWFGPAGTVTPLHYDLLDIMLTQMHGSKHVRLYTPNQTPLLYNSVGVFSDIDVEAPDLGKYPLYQHTEAIEFDLCAGDMLFLPQGHWHQVRSLEPSISVSFTNFLSE